MEQQAMSGIVRTMCVGPGQHIDVTTLNDYSPGRKTMTNLETIAAQRDEANMKLRKAIAERDAALAELARLKSATMPGLIGGAPPVPAVTPPQSKRARIFGGKP
jgi:outer membrane protein TolC